MFLIIFPVYKFNIDISKVVLINVDSQTICELHLPVDILINGL